MRKNLVILFFLLSIGITPLFGGHTIRIKYSSIDCSRNTILSEFLLLKEDSIYKTEASTFLPEEKKQEARRKIASLNAGEMAEGLSLIDENKCLGFGELQEGRYKLVVNTIFQESYTVKTIELRNDIIVLVDEVFEKLYTNNVSSLPYFSDLLTNESIKIVEMWGGCNEKIAYDYMEISLRDDSLTIISFDQCLVIGIESNLAKKIIKHEGGIGNNTFYSCSYTWPLNRYVMKNNHIRSDRIDLICGDYESFFEMVEFNEEKSR